MENTNDTLQETIQAIVNGELNEAARRALLEQAQADPLVADELGFSQSLARALHHPELVAASAVLSAVIAEEGFPPPAPPVVAGRSGKGWAWASVAVLLLLSLAGGYFWAENAGLFASPTQKIARAALHPLENVLVLPNNTQTAADLQKGMAAYESGRYAESARLLQLYISRNPDNAARVYLGVSHLMSGQSKEAIPVLALATQSSEPQIQEAALWYLSLAHLENDNTRAAIQALESIPPDGVYGPQARELLQKTK